MLCGVDIKIYSLLFAIEFGLIQSSFKFIDYFLQSIWCCQFVDDPLNLRYVFLCIFCNETELFKCVMLKVLNLISSEINPFRLEKLFATFEDLGIFIFLLFEFIA